MSDATSFAPSTVVVPLDGSAFAEQALPLAQQLAERVGAPLHLVLVHHLSPALATLSDAVVVDPELDRTSRGEERAHLEQVADRLRAAGPARVETFLLEPPVAGAIAEHAARHPGTLLVMTTHGRGVLSRLWLGSVADRLLRHLQTPVLLLRPDDAHPPLALASVRRILVTLDGSPVSERALAPAHGLAAQLGAELVLMRAVLPLAGGWAPVPGAPVVMPGPLEAELGDLARQYLGEQAAKLPGGVPVRTVVLERVDPAQAICEAAETEQADIIALATHGRGGAGRMLLGSVADKVIRGGHRAVLVVPGV